MAQRETAGACTAEARTTLRFLTVTWRRVTACGGRGSLQQHLPCKANGTNSARATRSRPTPRRASPRISRSASTPRACSAATRCSCCTAAATPRSRPRPGRSRREHEVLCVKGSGWDMGEIEPPGLPAVKLEPLRKLRALRRALRRGHGQCPAPQPARSGGAQPVGRDAAARLPAAQIHRPHACRPRC